MLQFGAAARAAGRATACAHTLPANNGWLVYHVTIPRWREVFIPLIPCVHAVKSKQKDPCKAPAAPA